jgi:hypothetical protein
MKNRAVFALTAAAVSAVAVFGTTVAASAATTETTVAVVAADAPQPPGVFPIRYAERVALGVTHGGVATAVLTYEADHPVWVVTVVNGAVTQVVRVDGRTGYVLS